MCSTMAGWAALSEYLITAMRSPLYNTQHLLQLNSTVLTLSPSTYHYQYGPKDPFHCPIEQGS